MLSTIKASPPTSLQRLQALDKQYSVLDEKLDQIALILKDSNIFSSQFLVSIDLNASRSKYHGRTEWAVRWAVGKLHGDSIEAKRARANIRIWYLIRNLVAMLPSRVAARTLNTQAFLAAVVSALQELIPGREVDSHPTSVVEESMGYQHTSNSARSKPGLSPKRKLSDEGSHVSGVKKQKTQDNQSKPMQTMQSLTRSLYHAIMACLMSVGSESTAGPHGFFLREHTTPTVRTDSSTAAKILGSWFRIQSLFLQDVNEIEYKNSVAYAESASDLTQVLRIWNSRMIVQQENANVSSHEFSAECLLPATVFLEISRNVGNYSGKDVWRTTRLTERLIAKHVFLPLRSYFSTHQNGAANVGDSANHHLWALFRPLRGSQPQSEFETDKIRPLAVSRLFELAVRCYPIDTPRKRATESRWLNCLFSNLVACIGYEALSNESKDLTIPPSTDIKPIRIMLQTAIKQGISISSDLLEMIVSKYSGLNTGDSIDWSLVALVIELESSLFTGGQPRKRDDGDRPLVQNLISRITDQIWTTFPCDKSYAKDSSSKAEYESVRSSIIDPLLRAFASSRQLPLFLDFWRRQLTVVKSHRHDTFANTVSGSERLSVWEDLVIVNTLSDVITASMTHHRVQEYIENLGSAFERLKIPDEHDFSAYGDLSLLSLLLQSLGEYEILQKLQPLLSQLFSRCVLALIDDGNGKGSTGATIWNLSSVIHNKLTIIGENANTKGDVKRLAEYAFDQMKLFESHSASSIDELAALLAATQNQICNLRARHLIQEEDTLWITQLEEATVRLSQEQSGALTRQVFTVIAAASPDMLRYKQYDDSRSHAGSNIAAEWLTWSNEPCSLWKLLSERSTDGNTNHNHALVGVLYSIQSMAAVPTQQIANEKTICLLAEGYSYIPPSIVPRWQREQFVDMSVAFICGSDVIEEYESIERLLSAVIRFLRVPCGTAELIKNEESLYDLVKHVDSLFLDRISKDHAEISSSAALDLLGCLASQVFSCRFAINDVTEFLEKVKVFGNETRQCLGHENTSRRQPAMLRVVSSGIEFFALKSKSFPSNKDPWRNLQTDICSSVCDQLASILKDQYRPESAMSASAQLQGTELLRLLTAMEDDILAANESTLRESLKTSMDTMPQGHQKWISERILQYEITCKTNSSRNEALDVTLSIDQFATAKQPEQIAVRRTTTSALLKMSPQHRVEAFQATLEEVRTCQEAKGSLDMLQIALKALIKHPQDVGKHFSDGIVLSCERLVETSDLQQFYLLTNILSMIKEAKPKDVSQNALEAIQLALLHMASASAPRLPSRAARVIFNQLCAIARLVLSTHRRKLRGRFGILTRLLQSLLRCLFIPIGASSGAMSASVKQPPWLSAESPLSRQQAAAFTRLVTLVCEPTTSSVASSKSNRPELTDETRQARCYAGQYMSYILMEYCNSQLQGRLPDPGMREQLMPGLYSACRVVELAGVQEATISALHAPARVVLKELWEDWKKFGRWDGA